MAPLIDSELFDSGHFVYTIHSVIPCESRQSFEDFQREMNEVANRFEGYRGQSISFQEKEMASMCWQQRGLCSRLWINACIG